MTPKQQRFVHAYVETGNATQSAIKAGYSKRSAMQIGEQNLRKHEIASAIAEAQAKAAERHEITLERIAEMMQEDRQLAIEAGQISAAATSSMNLAKLYGLIVDKQHHSGDMFKGLWNAVSGASKTAPAPLVSDDDHSPTTH